MLRDRAHKVRSYRVRSRDSALRYSLLQEFGFVGDYDVE